MWLVHTSEAAFRAYKAHVFEKRVDFVLVKFPWAVALHSLLISFS